MTTKELKAIAKQLGLKGFSRMKKEELERAVEEAQRSQDLEIGKRLEEEAKARVQVSLNRVRARVTKADAERALKEAFAKPQVVSITSARKEVKERLDNVVMEVPDKGKESAMKKVVVKHVPTKMVEVEGRRIVPVQRADGSIGAKFVNAPVPVPNGNAFWPYVEAGLVVPCTMLVYDQVDRIDCISSALDMCKKHGEVLVTNTAHRPDPLLYRMKRDLLVEIIGDDPSKKSPVDKMVKPTFSNTIMPVESATFETLRIVVVDTELKDGVETGDGLMVLSNDVEFWEIPYVKEGMPPQKQRPIRKFQIRTYGKGQHVIKALCIIGAKEEAREWVEYHGLDLGDCDGAIMKGNIKDCLGAKHGDIIEIPISKFYIANILRENEGSSRIGGQSICLDYEPTAKLMLEARPTHGEPGLVEKAKTLRRGFDFDATAMAEILKYTDTIRDIRSQQIKALWYAIPNGDGWKSPAWKSIYSQLIHGLLAYYRNRFMKTKTSNMTTYFKPHIRSRILGRKTNLDALELEVFEKYGEYVNLAIAPSDKKFHQQYDEFKYCSAGRYPIQWYGAIQEVLFLRKDDNGNIIIDPARLRNREGTLIVGDFEVSYNFMQTIFGDYDGDGAVFVFSNEAEYKAYRPKGITHLHPVDKVEEEIPEPMDFDEYVEALKHAYNNQAVSQANIGIMDNFRKLLFRERCKWNGVPKKLNGIVRVCKPIGPEISYIVGEASENAIKLKKWAGVLSDAVGKIKDGLEAKYAPDGRLPKKGAGPFSYRLTHNTFDLEENTGTESQIKELQKLVNAYNLSGMEHNDIYAPGWKELNGINAKVNEQDSQYWRTKFWEAWQSIYTFLGQKWSEQSLGKIERFGIMITDGDDAGKYDGYRAISISIVDRKDAGQISDEQADNEFTNLFDEIRLKMERFAAHQSGANMDEYIKFKELKVEALKKEGLKYTAKDAKALIADLGGNPKKYEMFYLALGVYLGSISFGASIVKDTGKPYSLPGYCFWLLPEWVLGTLAKKIHPNNPFIPEIEL